MAKKSEPGGVSAADLGPFIDAAGRALDLPVKEEWKPAIEANLRVTLSFAAAVAEFNLPEDAEPAPVFKA